MSTSEPVLFHFHGELAELAPAAEVIYALTRRASLKDAVEALGVPHTEVYALFVDCLPAGFDHLLTPGTHVEVLPAPEPVDVTRAQPLRTALCEAPPPSQPADAPTQTLQTPSIRFAADANVGKLATWLRLLGFDTFYDSAVEDAELAEMAAREHRVILSRDHGLLKRKAVIWGRLIRDNDPAAQLRGVMRHFGLTPPYRTFSRCLRCNEALTPVEKAEVLYLLQPKTKRYYRDFQHCASCQRIYWAGSHHGKMEEMVKAMAEAVFHGKQG